MSIPLGAKRIAPGVYAWRGEMHVDAAELLAANGFEPTPENAERLAAAALRACARRAIPIEVLCAEEPQGPIDRATGEGRR